MPADPDNDLLLVTCASGKQAAYLLPHITGKWKHVRLQCNRDASAQRLREQYPEAEVVKADMLDKTSTEKLLRGVSSVWYNCPGLHPHETQMGYTMVDAATKESKKEGSRLSHFVYSSVIQSQLRKLLNHDAKRYVEEYLMESGLDFTILQPSHFLNNFPLAMLLQEEEPVYKTPYGNVDFSFTVLEDYGEVCAKVLAQREKHYYAQYQLVSTYPTSYSVVHAAANKALGKELKVERVPLEQAVEGVAAKISGGEEVDPRMRDGFERLFLYYSRRGLHGSPTVMEWLLERKAMGIEAWMQKTTERARS